MPWADISDNDPGGADWFVRAAIHKVWHTLPPHKQDLDEVERQFRRLVSRAFRNFRDDADAFVRDVIDGPDEDAEA